MLQLVKATPVASFIILALVWVRGSSLSVLISFLMVLPVLYGAVRTGIRAADPQLLEMAKVFRLPLGRRLRAVWLPAVLPAFRQGCSVALGICWKSGVAAEVIGLPNGSIGDALYRAKITLSTGELFAWTFVIILLERRPLKSCSCLHWIKPWAGQLTGGEEGDKMLKLQPSDKTCFGSSAALHATCAWTVDAPAVLWAPSGWGKTTLLRILMGLERPTTGSVEGVGRVAAVFQEDRLCPQLNAVQNVTLVLPGVENQYKEQIISDFQQLGMDIAALQLPARRLSGGQKRRVALLRALWAPSDTLLLDEPFTGMDPDTLQRAAALLRQRCAGKPVLLATHDRAAIDALGWPMLELQTGTAGCGLQFHKQRITIRVSSAKRLHCKNSEPETEVFQLWLVRPFSSAKSASYDRLNHDRPQRRFRFRPFHRQESTPWCTRRTSPRSTGL